jgi:hypothetical protein
MAGVVFAEDAGPFGSALNALAGVPVIVSRGDRPGAEPLSGLLDTEPGATVAAAFAGLRPGRRGQDQRLGHRQTYAGRQIHRLARVGPDWRIRYRVLLLIDQDISQGNTTFVL